MRKFSIGDAHPEHAIITDDASGSDVATLNRLNKRQYPDVDELNDKEWQTLINLIHGAQGMLNTLRYLSGVLAKAGLKQASDKAKKAVKAATKC